MTLGWLTKKTTGWDLCKLCGIAIVANYAGTFRPFVEPNLQDVFSALWLFGEWASSPPNHGGRLSRVSSHLKSIPTSVLTCYVPYLATCWYVLVWISPFTAHVLAISISVAAEDVSGKILGVWWPIFTFALSGFEHCIANMFFATLAALHGADWNYG